ncbi:MAG: hypothetical protein HC857_11270 [Synechococcales cyanobacterium RU_4_20]|nr:hypothetical protein [Synechococcales cyanobacterium RU_4_20]
MGKLCGHLSSGFRLSSGYYEFPNLQGLGRFRVERFCPELSFGHLLFSTIAFDPGLYLQIETLEIETLQIETLQIETLEIELDALEANPPRGWVATLRPR